jgi:hypothetical protein
MKIVKMLLLQFLIALTVSAQQTHVWNEMLRNPEFSSARFHPTNRIYRYASHDFSTLLTPRSLFLGYIGADYQRLKIYFTSVSKNPNDHKTYQIEGISVVKENKVKFRGLIKLRRFIEYKQLRFGVDNRMKDHGIQSQGVAFAEYRFEEDKAAKHSGVFKGALVFSWYLDVDGVMQYNNIESHSDSFRNNQYRGTWTPHCSSSSKVANWGEFRIPDSGDLDVGAGEFSPNPEYLDRGWRDLAWYL